VQCTVCGHENPTGAQFCNGCGAGVSARCAACGGSNPAAARFCNQCGAPLSSPHLTTNNVTTSNLPPSPRSYTPKHLADKILTSRAALEGERKQVTVLFADIKGSMELAEQLDPEEWHRIMDRDHAVTHGVDGEHGGVYRDGTAHGGPLIMDKEFWQNAEALAGFLDGYETFGEERFFQALENVWQFVDRFMINHDVGELRTLPSHEGRPIDAKIGNARKVAYHSGRSLLECVTRLSRTSRSMGEQSWTIR